MSIAGHYIFIPIERHDGFVPFLIADGKGSPLGRCVILQNVGIMEFISFPFLFLDDGLSVSGR